jgi:hypothetical protein
MLLMARPVKVEPAKTFQDNPASSERATPIPLLLLILSYELVLPVPAKIAFGFTGLIAKELTDSSGKKPSVNGNQVGKAD